MDPSDPTTQGAPGPRPGRRRLDGRTVAICVCLALVAAIATALVLTMLTDDDPDAGAEDAEVPTMELIDVGEVLSTPMETVAGTATTLDAKLGEKPMVVNLWASNCAPCVEELPLLERAAEANPEVDFLGIDVLDRLDKARAMADKAGMTYPWVQDRNGDFANAMRTTALPSTFLFAPDGTILASKTEKAFKSQEELQAWIDAAT